MAAARYVELANGTKGLIIDIRNYPSEFVVFALGALLVDKRTDFVRFTAADLSNPGAFHWTPALSLTPEQPHYKGKIVILIDENHTELCRVHRHCVTLRSRVYCDWQHDCGS